jgi:hypothetical protein
MDLESKHPDNLHIREYLGNFTPHCNLPTYTISRTGFDDTGRPMPRTKTSADHLPPGQYRTDRDFPDKKHRLDEVGVGWLTRSAWSKNYTMPRENLDKLAARERRFTTGSTPDLVGPNTYGVGLANSTKFDGHTSPVYSIPRNYQNKERPLPREVSAADHLGPGTYDLPNKFNELGWRKLEKLEKAAKRNKGAWAKKEFGHIFACMKPRSGGAAAQPASGGH